MPSPSPQTIVIVERKSVGLAFLLTLLFGPLGMLYTTVGGALIMLVISAALGFFTFGVSLFVTHPICILWGCLAASASNKRLRTG
jgi:hypothetical protein